MQQLDHTAGHAAEHHGLNPKQYIYIGIALAVITGIELWVSYAPFADAAITTLLFILSAVKFAAVVAFFMHLRFEKRTLAVLFVGPMLLAALVLLALIAIFWTNLPDLLR